MERYQLKAEVREETGKGPARRIRKVGLVPGVVYGKNRSPQPLTVDPLDLQSKMSGNAIFDLVMVDDGEEADGAETVMIKEVQKDPIKGDIIHIDFHQISMDEKITVSVSLKLVGDAAGVIEGGVLQQLLREIDVECLPTDIPDEIELDISELDMGDSMLVSNIDFPEELDIVTPLDEVIATIVAPTELIEEEEEEEEEEFMEPEVIGEEGEVEEGEEEEVEEEEE